MKDLNKAISEDESLGEDFRIGHSYFCELKQETLKAGDLADIVHFELVPLLKEYWFDEPQKAKNWIARLEGIFR